MDFLSVLKEFGPHVLTLAVALLLVKRVSAQNATQLTIIQSQMADMRSARQTLERIAVRAITRQRADDSEQ